MTMLRGKRARSKGECWSGCCRDYRDRKCGTFRARDKRQWKKEIAE